MDRIGRSFLANSRDYLLTFWVLAACAASIVMCLSLGRYVRGSLHDVSHYEFGQADARVTATNAGSLRTLPQRLNEVAAVGAVYCERPYSAAITRTTGSTNIFVYEDPNPVFELYSIADGRAPTETNEVAISDAVAQSLDLKVDSTMTLAVLYSSAGYSETQSFAIAVRVTGIYAVDGHDPDAHTGRMLAFITSDAIAEWDRYTASVPVLDETTYYVTAADGYTEAELTSELSLLSGTAVRTRSDITVIEPHYLALTGRAITHLSWIVIFFSLTTAGMSVFLALRYVIFARGNEIMALARLGAKRCMVTRGLVGEAFLLAVLASIVGSLIGVMLSRFVPALLRSGRGGASLPPDIEVYSADALIGVALPIAAAGITAYIATRSMRVSARFWRVGSIAVTVGALCAAAICISATISYFIHHTGEHFIHQAAPSPGNNEIARAQVEYENVAMSAERVLFALMLGLTITCAVSFVCSTLLELLMRGRNITIRYVLGTPPGQLIRLFSMMKIREALVAAFAGAFAGVGISYVVVSFVAGRLDCEVAPRIPWIALAAFAGTFVSSYTASIVGTTSRWISPTNPFVRTKMLVPWDPTSSSVRSHSG